MKEKKKLKWHLLTVLVLTVVVIQTPFYLLNRPQVQQWLLRTYRPFSPWEITVGSLRTNPWRFKIDLENLHMHHPDGHDIAVESVLISINPLRALRSQVGIHLLEIKNPVITIAKAPDKDKPKKQFKIRTLLLLQNLMIRQGRIVHPILNLPSGDILTMGNFNLKLAPALIGGTELFLNLKQVLLEEIAGGKKSSEEIQISVTTNFANWSKTFPYVDNIDGNLQFKETILDKLTIKHLEAAVKFNKNKLDSKKFLAQIDDGEIVGDFDADFKTEKFSLNFDLPRPIHLPELGSETRTFNTAGTLQAKIALEGDGFDLNNSKGKGSVNATHLFENTEHPVHVETKFNWSNGAIHLEEAKVGTQEATVAATGSIDLTPPAFHLTLRAQNLPIEDFFEKFADKNLHPIHGKGTLEGTLDGIAKTIHLKLTADALDGGYGIVKSEKAHVDLDITYERLKLDGQLFTDQKQTGEAQFIIEYGPVVNDTRSKKITLTSKFKEQPLEKMLPDYGLLGNVTGDFKLNGFAQDIKGEGNLATGLGSFEGQVFEGAQTHFTLTNKNLVIDRGDFQLESGPTHFAKPLIFDFLTDGDFKLYGQIFSGVNIDIFYQGKTKRWEIRKFSIDDPKDPDLRAKFSGFVQPTGVDLKGEGNIELSRFNFFTQIVRDASGPALFDLHLHGTPPDLQMNGKIEFKNVAMTIKPFALSPEELNGTILFQGNRIQTDLLTGLLGTGNFELKGNMTHAHGKPASYDFSLKGKELYLHDAPSDFRMEYDADLTLKGPAQNPELAGSIVVLDGRYGKDFNIIEELQQAPKTSNRIREAAQEIAPLHFNLQVRNFGDLLIDNNIGKIALDVNVNIRGTKLNPNVNGTVTTKEGSIRYLGLDFDITNGFTEFRDKLDDPYLEIQAEKDLDSAHIMANLHGPISNLRMDLSGNSSEGPLEKKDVVSLILFGMTTRERVERAADQPEIGTALVAEQITHILQRPVANLTGLDVFRLETETTQTGKTQQFFLGKKLSDRLSVEFASEVNQYNDALQKFRLEYQLTDFLIFKGSRSSNESYQLNMGIRFISR